MPDAAALGSRVEKQHAAAWQISQSHNLESMHRISQCPYSFGYPFSSVFTSVLVLHHTQYSVKINAATELSHKSTQLICHLNNTKFILSISEIWPMKYKLRLISLAELLKVPLS